MRYQGCVFAISCLLCMMFASGCIEEPDYSVAMSLSDPKELPPNVTATVVEGGEERAEVIGVLRSYRCETTPNGPLRLYIEFEDGSWLKVPLNRDGDISLTEGGKYKIIIVKQEGSFFDKMNITCEQLA